MTNELTKAKNAFEQVVISMQNDLKIQAGKGVDQKYLNYRKNAINTLVEYYQKTNEYINAIGELNVESELRYSVLSRDTEKLVIYSCLHGINPNEVFLWTIEELQELQSKNMQLLLPMVDNKEFADDMDLSNKYNVIRVLAKGARYAR